MHLANLNEISTSFYLYYQVKTLNEISNECAEINVDRAEKSRNGLGLSLAKRVFTVVDRTESNR
ncbi:MAG: hypothetical protein ACTSWN_06380 [Promethearchaeota archaeon]